MQTNCEISREAWYYLINIDGEDFSKNGEKVKYELKGSDLSNLCEVT